MFVNLLELLQFVYLIKTLFHKKAGGLPSGGRAAHSAPPGVRSASRSSSPSVCLSDGAPRSPLHPARHRTPLATAPRSTLLA